MTDLSIATDLVGEVVTVFERWSDYGSPPSPPMAKLTGKVRAAYHVGETMWLWLEIVPWQEGHAYQTKDRGQPGDILCEPIGSTYHTLRVHRTVPA